MGLCPGCGAPVDPEALGSIAVHCMDCDPTGLADLLARDLDAVKEAHRDLRSAAMAVLDLVDVTVRRGPHVKALRELERLARP